MGFLDSLKQQALAAANKYAGDNPQLQQEIADLVHGGGGGLSGLVQKFESSGLGQQVQSWIGTGPNAKINPQQIQDALGSEKVKQIASRLGIDPNVVSQKLATILPEVVNHLTPDGKVPTAVASAAGPGAGAPPRPPGRA